MPRDLIASNVRDFTVEQPRGMTVLDSTLSEQEQEDFLAKARQLIVLKEQKATLAAREVELRKELMAVLDRAGEPYGDYGQHRAFKFPRPIRGIARLVQQAKVTQSVDVVVAEAVARQKEVYDRWFKPVPTLDQAAVMVALEEDLISDEEFERIFPKTTTWALITEKVKGR